MRHTRLRVASTEKAIYDINSWGDYPEELDDYQRERCFFYSIRETEGYVWFEILSESPEKIAIHLAFNPENRKKAFSAMLWGEILAEAINQKAKVLLAFFPTEVVKRYALRLGFVQDETIADLYKYELEDL